MTGRPDGDGPPSPGALQAVGAGSSGGETRGNLAILHVCGRDSAIKDCGVVGLDEAFDLLLRYLESSKEGPAARDPDDPLSGAVSIGFSRSKQDWLDIIDLGPGDLWVRAEVSIAGVPWTFRPFWGSRSFDLRWQEDADAERWVRWFFTLSGKQVCEQVRREEQDRSGLSWAYDLKRAGSWASIVVLAIFWFRMMSSEWARDDLGRFWFLLSLPFAWYLLNLRVVARRCRNCGAAVIDDRLRPDGRCNHCRVPIPHERIDAARGPERPSTPAVQGQDPSELV